MPVVQRELLRVSEPFEVSAAVTVSLEGLVNFMPPLASLGRFSPGRLLCALTLTFNALDASETPTTLASPSVTTTSTFNLRSSLEKGFEIADV